jgi:hypothetical protein
LGTHLLLPPWFESIRKELQKVLPQVIVNGKILGEKKK